MSRNYQTFSDSFHLTQHKVREMIQSEISIFFSDIKQEIEQKIKQIDLNIRQLKKSMKVIQESFVETHPNYQLFQRKLTQLNAQFQGLQKQQKAQIIKIREEISTSFNSRPERRQSKSPLFRKSTVEPIIDLNNIIFGDQNSNKAHNQHLENRQKPEYSLKPPPIRPPLPISKQKQQLKEGRNQAGNPVGKQTITIVNDEFQYLKNEKLREAEKQQQKEPQISSNLIQNLNKNKNSFLRKKSLKKFGTITEQQVQQSILSSN